MGRNLRLVKSEGSWKAPRKAIALRIHAKAPVALAALAAAAALVAMAAILTRPAHAAIARPGAESAAWKKGASGFTCEDRLSNLYLAGSFVMPTSGEAMNLWIGKPRVGAKDEVLGFVGKPTGENCEAQCKVVRFERFKKDLQPALMEMDCEGSRLKTMRMPLHVQWIREKTGFETMVRLGSSIYGMEEAPLRLQVNRYEMTKVAKVAKK